MITGPTMIKWNIWPGAVMGFTTVHGGVSNKEFSTLNVGLHVNDDDQNVVRNREIIAEQLQLPLSRWIFADQTHETRCQYVTEQQCGLGSTTYDTALVATDGLYSDRERIALALCFADCVPLYFYAREQRMFAVAHAGWRGTVANIIGEMLAQWEARGIRREQVQLFIGPSIGECCYEVDDVVITKVNAVLQRCEQLPYTKLSSHQYRLNLKRLNELIALQEGITQQNITISEHCTSCEDTLFFSYRRDGGKTGRMMSFMMLEGEK